jgi:RecA/RadA recombinase
MVDAFVPIKAGTVCLQTGGEEYELTAYQLRQYLMADQSEKEELLDQFEHREEKRDAIEQQTQSHYEDKYGTNPRVRDGLSELPPWKRGEEKIQTGILPLDMALGGGIAPGTAINVSGNPDAGKSTLSYAIAGGHIRYYRRNVYQHVIDTLLPEGLEEASSEEKEEVLSRARAAAEGERIAVISNERFDPKYATKAMNLGSPLFESELSPREVANQSLSLIDTEFVEESTQESIEAMDTDSKQFDENRGPSTQSYELPITFRELLWDSLDASRFSEEHFSGNDQEKLRMGDESRMGTQSRLLAEFFRKAYKFHEIPSTVQMVSQYRANIGSYGGGKSPHRGNAHPYFTDVEMDVWHSKSESKSLSGNLQSVHISFEKVHVGANVTEGDDIQVYLRPGQGYDPVDNAIGYCLNQAEQKEGATNGVGCLYRNASWVYYRPPGEEEELSMQGTDPEEVYGLVKEAGAENEFYDQILESLTTGDE